MPAISNLQLTEEGEPTMTRGKILTTVLVIAGALLLGLGAGSNAASAQARRATTPVATFPRLPPPPPIVGYPPQIYMFGPPPGVVGSSFGLNFGFADPARRHDFHRFDRPFENPRDR